MTTLAWLRLMGMGLLSWVAACDPGGATASGDVDVRGQDADLRADVTTGAAGDDTSVGTGVDATAATATEDTAAAPPDGATPGPGLHVTASPLLIVAIRPGDSAAEPIVVENGGPEAMTIEGVALVGDASTFTLQLAQVPIVASDHFATIDLAPPVTLAPGERFEMSLRYQSHALHPDRSDPAEVRVRSRRGAALETHVVSVVGLPSPGAPCFVANPGVVDLGGQHVGTSGVASVTITSCGESSQHIDHIDVGLRGEVGWPIDDVALSGGAREDLDVAPRGAFTLDLVYAPTEVSPVTPAGPDRTQAALWIETSRGEVPVVVSGFAYESSCPTAAIAVDEGDVVPLGTTLHLGLAEVAWPRPIAGWSWSITDGQGDGLALAPSPSAARPSFTPANAGTYTVRVDFWDDEGTHACTPAVREVKVIDEPAVRVEVTWVSPDDESGFVSDVDLHMLHPNASLDGVDLDGDGRLDGWFDYAWDAHWFNDRPSWAGTPQAITEGIGEGPEIGELDPMDPGTYTIGVHLWDGPPGLTTTTVRVFHDGALVYERSALLQRLDLWTVARVRWPWSGAPEPGDVCRGTFTPCDGADDCPGSACVPRIAPGYEL